MKGMIYIDGYNNQEEYSNSFVGDGNILLYTLEEKIAINCQKIMKNYSKTFSSKDFVKKTIELFHLLVYLDINEGLDSLEAVEPNEPGDFIIKKNGNEVLYEIVTVFGDVESKEMTDKIKMLLEVKNDHQLNLNKYPNMKMDKMNNLLKKILLKKRGKSYFKDYDEAVLLLITSEHDRSGTVQWYLLGDFDKDVKDFTDKTGALVHTMNYFSSGVDTNPVVGNLKDDIHLYNQCFY